MANVIDNIPSGGTGSSGTIDSGIISMNGNYPYNQHTQHLRIYCSEFTKLHIDSVEVKGNTATGFYSGINGYDENDKSLWAQSFPVNTTHKDLEFDLTNCASIHLYTYMGYANNSSTIMTNLRFS